MLNRRTANPVSNGDGDAAISAGEVELARVAAFRVGKMEVDPPTLQVDFGGHNTTVEPRVMQVLVVLAGSRGSVVSRDQLIEQCWANRVVGEDAINRCLAKVRRLGSESCAFEVETIPRVGYRLIEQAPLTQAGRHRRRLLRAWCVGGALLLILLITGLLWHLQTSSPRTVPPIALTAFVALNADADAKPYADSVTEAVSNALVNTGARLASTDRRMTTIGQARKAGAALLLRGTVRREGDQVEVTTTIESVRDGSGLVSQSFNAPLSEAAALPDRVAAAVAATLSHWISAARAEPKAEIAEQVLVSWTLLKSSPTRAISDAREMARVNPKSATAQASFAAVTAFFLDNLPRDQRDTTAREAREAAQTAGDLTPASSFLLPCLLTPPGRSVLTPQCDSALRQSIAADPDPPFANQFLSGALGDSGLLHEAASVADIALAQSPYDSQRLIWRIVTLQFEHPADQENALPALLERERRFAPDLLKSELIYEARLANGDLDGAQALLDDATTGEAIAGGRGKQISEDVLRAARTRSAVDIARARRECAPPTPTWGPPAPTYSTCLVGLTMVGDLDSAFTLAERGYRDVQCCTAVEREKAWLDGGGLYYPRFQLWGAAMAPFRADRRFIEVARRTGLLAYWRSGHPPDFCSFERVPVCDVLRAK